MPNFLRPLLQPLSAALVCVLAASSLGAALPTGSPELASTLGVARAARIRAFLDGNTTPLVAPCTGNTRLMTEGLPTVIGSANIAAYYRAFFARFTVRAYTRHDFQTWDLGPRVAEFGRFTLQLAPKAGGAELSLHGKYLELWDHDSGNGLQLAVVAWNFDAWLPNGDGLRFDGIPSVRTALQARAPLDNDLSVELAASGLLMQRALIEHDAMLWSRFYADDAVLLPNNAPIALGHAAIAAYLEAHCRELPIFEQLDLRNDRIEEAGGYIYEFASHIANWRNSTSSGVSTGKNLRIWRREPDHMLKMILQIGAYD
jgi:ketosteroid isomerase-like protein